MNIRVLILVAVLSLGFFPATALADQVPPEFLGTWGQRCTDPAAPRIALEPEQITITSSGRRYTYAGVEVSHTWFGGARASGDRVWLPTSKEPGAPFEFIVAPPPYGKEGFMILEEGHPDHGREVKSLFGPEFYRCPDSASAPENKPAASSQSSGNRTATVKTDPAMVNVNGTATDGKTTFSGGCNTLLAPGFMGSLYGYGGDALQRIDDQSEAVTFDVAGRNGTESFAGEMHYFAPDEAWVITDALPVAFLEAFARGDTLRIRNGKGEEAAVFEMGGSAKAVQIMRQACRM